MNNREELAANCVGCWEDRCDCSVPGQFLKSIVENQYFVSNTLGSENTHLGLWGLYTVQLDDTDFVWCDGPANILLTNDLSKKCQ